MKDRTDEDLAREAQGGSLPAFEALVLRHERRLLSYLARIAGNRSDAEEIAQQAFVAAYRKLHRYRTDHAFGAWLFTIARRLAIDAWRAKRDVGALDADRPCDARSPAAEAAASDLWSLARRELSERQFSSLWLMYAEGRSVAEIARLIGGTAIAIKVGLHRARRKLASALGPASDWRVEWGGAPSCGPLPTAARRMKP